MIVNQGGLAPGGLNFDAKLRRESTDVEDLFIAHISGMDTWARALRCVAQIKQDGKVLRFRKQLSYICFPFFFLLGLLEGMVAERYSSYNSGIGAKIESGTTSFQELEKYALEHGEPKVLSAKQEKYEQLLNSYI